MKYYKPLLLVFATALAGSTLGASTMATGGIAHPQVVSEVAVNWTPHLQATAAVPHPLALAIDESAGTMYVGGNFRAVSDARRTTTYVRGNVMSFDAATGAVNEGFDPILDGQVFSVLGAGDSVFVGGKFKNVDGVRRGGIAKLDAETGAIDPSFRPPINGSRVEEMRLVNNRLIVGGSFPKRLVALDPETGADTGYINLPITGVLPLINTKTTVDRFAINPQGTLLVAVGNFTAVDGVNRQRAFMLTLGPTSASLNPWYYQQLDKKCWSVNPIRQSYLDDVDFSPDGSYFVFAAGGFVPLTTAEIGLAVCDAAARFETNIPNPVKPTWINYTGGDTLHSVAVTGAAVYVQGHNRWLNNPLGRDTKEIGAVDRPGIGAIDPVTGMALPWNPTKPAKQGGHDMLVTPEGLWVASDSTYFGGRYHRGIAFAPLP